MGLGFGFRVDHETTTVCLANRAKQATHIRAPWASIQTTRLHEDPLHPTVSDRTPEPPNEEEGLHPDAVQVTPEPHGGSNKAPLALELEGDQEGIPQRRLKRWGEGRTPQRAVQGLLVTASSSGCFAMQVHLPSLTIYT